MYKIGGISGILSSLFVLISAFIAVGFLGGRANLSVDGLVLLLYAAFSVPFVFALYQRLSKKSKILALFSLLGAFIPIVFSLFINSQKFLYGTKPFIDAGHPIFFAATVAWLGISNLLILRDKAFPKALGYLGVLGLLLILLLFVISIANIKLLFPFAQNAYYVNRFFVVPVWTLWVSIVLLKLKFS